MESSGHTLVPSSISFGNGLVEVAALTTLIGSGTAGDLILGNRGPAGLVWGSISAFGAISVVKACAGAASPGWLRQLLVLRTTSSDKAVGMDLSLSPDQKMTRRIRGVMEGSGALGVSFIGKSTSSRTPVPPASHTFRDIYAFDSATSLLLSEFPPTPLDCPLTIYTHYRYPFYRQHHLPFHAIALCLALLLKSVEIYILFAQGGIVLSFLSGIPFLLSFAAALYAHVHKVMSSRKPAEVDGSPDLVTAFPLPTTKLSGGSRKVVLGASLHPRTGIWWKLFWIMMGTVHAVSIVLSYILLGQHSTKVVVIWAGFQLFLVTVRLLIFNLTETTHHEGSRPMKSSKLSSLPLSMKLRVANLAMGVGSYQAHIHPRGLEAYLGDSFSVEIIAKLLVTTNVNHMYPLSLQAPSTSAPNSSVSIKLGETLSASATQTTKVNIVAIIGDTVLSSAVWMLGGTKLTPLDLYDSCILMFEIAPATPSHPSALGASSSRIIAVPSARVLSARTFGLDLEDSLEPVFPARGVATQAPVDQKEWIYWVPCDGGKWLQIKNGPSLLFNPQNATHEPSQRINAWPKFNPSITSKANIPTVLGNHIAEVFNDSQLSRMIEKGNLHISLRDIQEVRGVVDNSREASKALMEFLH